MAMDQAQQEEYAKNYGQIVAKTWADPAFKQRLFSDPASVLKEYGIDVPAGVEVRPVENSESMVYLPLPPQPEAEISDEQLEQVAGGTTAGSAGSLSTLGCALTTLSTGGCAGTAGTAGGAGTSTTV